MEKPLSEKLTDIIVSKKRMLQVEGITYQRFMDFGFRPWHRSADTTLNELLDEHARMKNEITELKTQLREKNGQ